MGRIASQTPRNCGSIPNGVRVGGRAAISFVAQLPVPATTDGEYQVDIELVGTTVKALALTVQTG